jgi:hypothetical protein
MNNFFINRFKSLSFAEIPYRVKQLILKKLEKLNLLKSPEWDTVYKSIKILEPSEDIIKYPVSDFTVFGKKFDYTAKIDWHLDFFSGKTFQKTFSKTINIRKDPNLSAKVVWEVNRLQFLTQIAIEYRKFGKPDDLKRFVSIIQSWKEENPYLKGINWYSNIEVNLRLITWFLCWEILDADKLILKDTNFGSFANNDWLPAIYQHCVYSHNNPSKFSSSNNHLISEYAGLFIAAVKWNFTSSKKWIAYSQKGLEKEMLRQHSNNGINKEEAAEYIQFITDFFLLAYIVGENSGHSFSEKYKDQLHKIFLYIFEMLDSEGNFPKYGDEDDGKCFVVDFDEDFNNFKSLLTSGTVLFKDAVLKSKSHGYDLKNAVLFGLKGLEIFESVEDAVVKTKSKFYPEEGHFFIKKKEGNHEIYIHFDAAPLGFLSIAAHGHADALSFILHVDGHPVFVDPGTYTYHTEPQWRNYFVGTLAHNTIRVNKENQATLAGSTLWLNHYKCNVVYNEQTDEKVSIKASHNGYEKFGITHTREIDFDQIQNKLVITDWVESEKKDDYFLEIPFHCHPLINVKADNDYNFDLTTSDERKIRLTLDERLRTTKIKGQEEPEIAGWYSKSFLKKEPCNTIIGSLTVTGNIKLRTVITIGKL